MNVKKKKLLKNKVLLLIKMHIYYYIIITHKKKLSKISWKNLNAKRIKNSSIFQIKPA